jgi:hypothetical protein
MQIKKKIKVNQDIKPLLNDDPVEPTANGQKHAPQKPMFEIMEEGKTQDERNKEVNSTSSLLNFPDRIGRFWI